MKKTIKMEWSDMDTGSSKGLFVTAINDNDDYVCPTCGEPCTYNEGQIGEDFMGNTIYGWWFDCHACNISSDSTEGNWSTDYP